MLGTGSLLPAPYSELALSLALKGQAVNMARKQPGGTSELPFCSSSVNLAWDAHSIHKPEPKETHMWGPGKAFLADMDRQGNPTLGKCGSFWADNSTLKR